MLNLASYQRIMSIAERSAALRVQHERIAGAMIVDAGVHVSGSLAAGVLMAQVCLGDLAEVTIVGEDSDRFASDVAVMVQTDSPVLACLGGQYAGWPVSAGNYFAMGSGPMRMARGREEMLLELELRELPEVVAGVLESTLMPTPEAIHLIADQTNVAPEKLSLVVAPSGSIAGSVQVVARSVETAMHKLHALKFDVRSIFSAVGMAPIPPPAKPSDAMSGIGRTNDAILYGGRVTLWVDCEQRAIDDVAEAVPSCSSPDHGRPFSAIFKDAGHDFYKVDPHLFCPAVVTIINRRSGIARRAGAIQTDILRESFFA